MKFAVALGFIALVCAIGVNAGDKEAEPVLESMKKLTESFKDLTGKIKTFVASGKPGAPVIEKINATGVELGQAQMEFGQEMGKLGEFLGFPAPAPPQGQGQGQ